MSEDFLFTDGTNPSALLDILDEDEADVNTSFDVDKILAKFLEPTPKSCNYDRSRLEKRTIKHKIFVNRFIQMLVRVLRMYTGAVKLNRNNVPISLKRLHSIMSGGCKIIQLSSGEFNIIPNSWKYKNEIMFVLNIFFQRLSIGNNLTGCSTWAPKQQPSCNTNFFNLIICLFKEQEEQFECLLHFFKQTAIGEYKLDFPLQNSPLLQQVVGVFRDNNFN